MKTKPKNIILSLIFIVVGMIICKFIFSINEGRISETSETSNTAEEGMTSEKNTVETNVPIPKETDDAREKPDLSHLSNEAIEAYRNIVIYYIGFEQVHDNVKCI